MRPTPPVRPLCFFTRENHAVGKARASLRTRTPRMIGATPNRRGDPLPLSRLHGGLTRGSWFAARARKIPLRSEPQRKETMKRLLTLSVLMLLAGTGTALAQDVRYNFD